MGRKRSLREFTSVVLLVAGLVSLGCSTRKFTRNEIRALETDLTVRLETDEGKIAAVENNAKALSGRIDTVDKKADENASQIAGVRNEVSNVDRRAGDAATAARNAQTAADRANGSITSLETSVRDQFRNLSDYTMVTEKQILFDFDSSKIREDFESTLSDLANQVKQNSNMFVVLEGRTDDRGNDEYNIRLGEKRNDAVTRFLIVTQSVPIYKVFQTSFGKEQPLAGNDSKEGREKNRSVVLRIYRSGAATARQ